MLHTLFTRVNVHAIINRYIYVCVCVCVYMYMYIYYFEYVYIMQLIFPEVVEGGTALTDYLINYCKQY